MLKLVDVKETASVQPAAFHELDAARYLGSNRTHFRGLVKAGVIPFSVHRGGKTRIYLREHLDRYLHSLKWRTMGECENSHGPQLKGVS